MVRQAGRPGAAQAKYPHRAANKQPKRTNKQLTWKSGESKQAGKPRRCASPSACDRSTGPMKQQSTPGTDKMACKKGERVRVRAVAGSGNACVQMPRVGF